MRRRKKLQGAGLLLAAILLTLAVPATAFEDEILVINEVLADPATDWDGDGVIDAKGDEWIEIANVSDEPVNIGNWWLRDLANEIPDLHLSGVLDPGEVRVFYGSQAMAWQESQGLSTTGFSLNNTGDFVKLLRTIPGTEGPEFPELELLYSISYEDHEAEDDRSTGWNFDYSDWVLFDGMNLYGGTREPSGTGCSPTPGWVESCPGLVPVEAQSFGTVKAVYR